MNDSVKVAISSDFLTAFARLPRGTQGKVTDFINKFRNNPKSPGINYEKIQNAFDDKICSVRIDDTYRGIVARDVTSGVYLMLWVDHHDEAYDWAKRKRCEVNPKSGAVQVFDIQAVIEEIPEAPETTLFNVYKDEDLLTLGVPEVQLQFVKSISDKKSFYASEDKLPKDAYEYLTWLAEDVPMEEVLELAESDREETVAEDLSEALGSAQSKKSFVVIEGEDELRTIMAEPLEKWRIFLHPAQRRIVYRNFSGPARVIGGAGTGKTVVAMHRAKYLASILEPEKKILFTTYTANLAADIKENLRKLCTKDELRRIEVINLDAWVSRYLREHGYTAEVVYDDQTDELWKEAYTYADLSLDFPESFYKEEWIRVVAANEAFTLPQYVVASRIGRGTRLDRKKRIAVWKVFEAYMSLMKERGVRDVYTAMYECRMIIENSKAEPEYRSIIVDEGQDLSVNAYRLIRRLAGFEHENDLFIVGDSHQRIYKNYAALSKCGIYIRGRSSVLRINYRTTEEIRKYAFALLNGISFDDLDEAAISKDRCRSLTHGVVPEIRFFDNAGQEIDFLVSEIKSLIESGTEARNICVVARTHKLISDYIVQLTVNNIRAYEIRTNKIDDRGLDGVRVATMHRVKGLEFRYIFVVAANDRIIPLKSAIDTTDAVSKAESYTKEKCLLYVALTRAQKGAYITGYGRKSEFLK